MKRRTKIVCTLGPAVDSRDKIRELIDAGMNVARINCSHGDWESRARWVAWIRELSHHVAPIAILVDLQGPKFRVGDLPSEGLTLTPNQVVTVGRAGSDIPIPQTEIVNAMSAGGRLLLGDGEIELKLLSSNAGQCEARVTCGGVLKSRKGVTLVGKVFDVPALTDKDRDDIQQALRLDIDILALSYVKHARDVMELREIVQKTTTGIQICAKIEMRQGVQELESILRVVDAVMVARGDMGLQMEIEDVPIMQKKIIRECTAHGTPVITATQMLESMISAPRPTRAEATDVANAVLDGSDALMLSAETSVGSYPIDCVRTMARIAEKAESLYDRQKIERQYEKAAETGVRQTDAIAHCVELLAKQIRPSAILTLSTSGQTARLVSKYRPRVAVLCATSDLRTHRQLALVWGVEAILVAAPIHTDDAIETAIRAFREEKRLKVGDLVIVTAGVPAGQRGNTNLIMAEVIKE